MKWGKEEWGSGLGWFKLSRPPKKGGGEVGRNSLVRCLRHLTRASCAERTHLNDEGATGNKTQACVQMMCLVCSQVC